MELIALLGVPLVGGALLALFGHRSWAAEVNAASSFLTLVGAVFLTAEVIRGGPLTVWDESFFIDSFNVFLVALTAFVGFTTSLFSRPYMRNEHAAGKLNPPRLRLYHSMFQLFMFTM